MSDGAGVSWAGIEANPEFRVLFVRHAESEINIMPELEIPRHALPPDSGVTYPLSKKGMRQARALGDALAGERLIAIYSSTRMRCVQTATAIALAHELPVRPNDDLVEIAFIDPAASMGMIEEGQIRTVMGQWAAGDIDAAAPGGGESLREVFQRFLPAAHGIIAKHAGQEGTLVIVAHGGVLDVLSTFEALHAAGQKTPYDHIRNVFIFVVNSLATPPNDWNLRENPPGLFDVLIKATGTPIDRYSYDTVETLRDIQARWATLREVRDLIKPYPALADKLPSVMRAPEINIRVIEVSFSMLPDKAERDYLNTLPTSFVLDDDAVDRLRLAAKNAILASPEVQRLIASGALRVTGPGPRVAAKTAGSARPAP